jgi:PleD family two-component response regulator
MLPEGERPGGHLDDVLSMPTILFADDEPAMRDMVSRVLEAGGHNVRLAKNGSDALEQIRSASPDLIVLDYHMGDPNGLQVCRDVKSSPRFGHLPVLILTGRNGMDSRLRGFDAGADDYLTKPFDPRELLARIGALLRLANRGLERNPTSGLPGGEAIRQAFGCWQARGKNFAVCYLDLDDFKPFGDRFGFRVADSAIREAGEILRSVTDSTDAFVGHVGGDDFVILTRPEDARSICEEAQRRLQSRLIEHLPRDVVEAGCYTAEGRDGTVREFSITRLSAAIVRIPPDIPVSLTELGETVAHLKRLAKRATGSGIVDVDLPGDASSNSTDSRSAGRLFVPAGSVPAGVLVGEALPELGG